MTNPRSLIFVYNADSGLFNALTDTAHKLLSPGTYQCQLCALTHGHFGMHREWADFLEGLGVPCEFRHRDELPADLDMPEVELPAVLFREGQRLTPCLDGGRILECETLGALERMILEQCLGTETIPGGNP